MDYGFTIGQLRLLEKFSRRFGNSGALSSMVSRNFTKSLLASEYHYPRQC